MWRRFGGTYGLHLQGSKSAEKETSSIPVAVFETTAVRTSKPTILSTSSVQNSAKLEYSRSDRCRLSTYIWRVHNDKLWVSMLLIVFLTSVRLSACNCSRTAERIFIKSDIGIVHLDASRCLDICNNTNILHEDVRKFLRESRLNTSIYRNETCFKLTL
jgi:hypothetical protein